MKAYEIQTNLDSLQSLAEDINNWAAGKGFWKLPHVSNLTLEDRQALHKLQKSQKLLLVVTELAELTEGLRGAARSRIEGFTNEEEELADTIIRLLDYAGQYGLRVGDAIGAKMAFNEGRPFRHGKEF